MYTSMNFCRDWKAGGIFDGIAKTLVGFEILNCRGKVFITHRNLG